MPRDIVIPVGGSSFVVGDDDDHSSFLSVAEALEGDPGRLFERRDAGVALSQNERDFLAGKMKRVANRPPTRSTKTRNFNIAWLVRYCEHLGGWPHKVAVAEAMAAFEVSRRTVFKAVAEVREDPDRQHMLEQRLEQSMRDEVFSEDRIKAPQVRAHTSITWSKEVKT
jgi:hypothetical protein